jgi:viral A-type inclusion protein, putative
MLRPEEALKLTYENQYKIENLGKSTQIIGQIQNEVLKIVSETNKNSQDINQNTTVLINKTKDVNAQLVETIEQLELISKNEQTSNLHLDNLNKNLEEVPTKFEDVKSELLEIIETDSKTNVTQLSNIETTIEDLENTIKETSPTESLNSFDKAIELAHSELRVTKDDRLDFVSKTTTALLEIDKIAKDLKEHVNSQISENQSYNKLIVDISEKLEESMQNIDKLRPTEDAYKVDLENNDLDSLLNELKNMGEQPLPEFEEHTELVLDNVTIEETDEVYEEDSEHQISEEQPKNEPKTFWGKVGSFFADED